MGLIIRWIGVAVLCFLSFVLGMLTCQRSEDEAMAAVSVTQHIWPAAISGSNGSLP